MSEETNLPDNFVQVAVDHELAKRFYITGYRPVATCPDCGQEGDAGFDHQYVSYPIVGEELTADVCCSNEDCVRWGDPPIATVKFKLHIIVEHLSPEVELGREEFEVSDEA